MTSAINPRRDGISVLHGSECVKSLYESTSAEQELLDAPRTSPTRQFAGLVLAPIEANKLATLRALLERVRRETIAQMQGSPVARPLVPFQRMQGLHYARFVVIEPPSVRDPLLAFATDFDGPAGAESCARARPQTLHHDELLAHARPGLEAIFACCEGFRAGELASYFAQHQRAASTFYVGASGRSRNQILWESDLRRRVDEILDREALSSRSPAEIRSLVRERLRGLYPGGIPAFPPQPDGSGKLKAIRAAVSGGAVVTLVALVGGTWWLNPFPYAALVALALPLSAATAFVLRFRRLEQTDPQFQPEPGTRSHQHHEQVAIDENQFLQNQLTHVVDIKPGSVRWLLIRMVFAALQLVADHVYNRGKLGGIPSIHFASWALGPRRSVIFFSNFDSSWQSYLGDFIDQASSGLTAVWSNTVGYPKTTWLVRAGSRDAARFLAWTRHHQLPTQVWYCAYPGLRSSTSTPTPRSAAGSPTSLRTIPSAGWRACATSTVSRSTNAMVPRAYEISRCDSIEPTH